MMNVIEQKNKQSLMGFPEMDQLQFVPGIWVKGKYIWLQNCMEKVLYEEKLVMKVKQEPIHSKIRFYSVYVSNHGNSPKEVKVMAMHYFSSVNQNNLTFISPNDSRIFHLADDLVFLVNAKYNGSGLKEYTTAQQWNAFTDKVWSSVQTGRLHYQPMAKGPSASIFTMKMYIHPHETCKMHIWSIAGPDKSETIAIEKALLKQMECI